MKSSIRRGCLGLLGCLVLAITGRARADRPASAAWPSNAHGALVALGIEHSCAVTTDGRVACWGGNSYGQVVAGLAAYYVTPTIISDVNRLSSITAGGFHTCALRIDGSVWCWGRNDEGQLGHAVSPKPMQVPAFDDNNPIVAITAGRAHTCALDTMGEVHCWGAGFGSGVNVASGAQAVSSGPTADHTCAIMGNRTVQCWGKNTYGQLGRGTTSAYEATPAPVASLSNVVALALGESFSCALDAAGLGFCWGENTYSQASRVAGAPVLVPDLLPPYLTAYRTSIAAARASACTRFADGGVKCWGANHQGELGTGTSTPLYSYTPPRVPGAVNTIDVIAGGRHFCASQAGASVTCWGDNSVGQLGFASTCTGTSSCIASPGSVQTTLKLNLLSGPSVAVGEYHTCVKRGFPSDGSLACWGSNASGQLGDNSTVDSGVPVAVSGLTDVVSVVAGKSHTCALRYDGTVACWGSNANGQVGTGSLGGSYATPSGIPSASLSGVVQLATHESHTCALLADGALKCWGDNSYLQCGVNNSAGQSTTPSPTRINAPAAPEVDRPYSSVAAGYRHTCAIRQGRAWCWGDGSSSRMGNPSVTGVTSVPTLVSTTLSGQELTQISQMAPGDTGGCALANGGQLHCWGVNTSGYVGDGTNTPVPQPKAIIVPGVDFISVASGRMHNCALAAGSQQSYCWGNGVGGKLGNGSYTSRYVPTLTGFTFATALAVGRFHACTIGAAGRMRCWGYNNHGQLGNGSTDSAWPTPTPPLGSLCGSDQTNGGCVEMWFTNQPGPIGCQHYENVPAPSGRACDDSAHCTTDDHCDGSYNCLGTPVTFPDDGNPCSQDDTCTESFFPNAPPAPSTTPCSDGIACTVNDHCSGTDYSCLTGTPAPVGTGCDDGNLCNGRETCRTTGCQPGIPPVLDDGNPCTTDSCDSLLGVVHTNVAAGTLCASGTDLCVASATCDSQGQCIPVPAVPDLETHPNTIPICDPTTGFTYVPIPAAPPGAGNESTKDASSWLYEGTNPIQIVNNTGVFDPAHAALIHGLVLDRYGNPVPNADIEVVGHLEFGRTTTLGSGTFHMVVNGGGPLTVSYKKQGYLEAQRTVQVPWDDHVWASNVILVQSDPKSTWVDLTQGGQAFQVARGSTVTDESGTRQATVLFPRGTTATMLHADGTTTEALRTMNVRITEFTVGAATGPGSMPAELPPASAYTYAIEINADEAVDADAPSVTFQGSPLVLYVDNFLNFAPGTKVPVGAYNRQKAVWIPEPSGRVINVVGVTNGLADIDIDGVAETTLAESAAELATFGISAEERAQLASLYPTVPGGGKSLWRVTVAHFTSPLDLNWAPPPPPDPQPKPPEPPVPPRPCDSPCCGAGSGSNGPATPASSTLLCGQQVYLESVPVAGTPFSLTYASHRVPGYVYGRTLEIPIVPLKADGTVDERVTSVYLAVSVAGRTFQYNLKTDPPPPEGQDIACESEGTSGPDCGGLVCAPERWACSFRMNEGVVFPFRWDGKDWRSQKAKGPQPLSYALGYIYDGKYYSVDAFGYPQSTGAATPTDARRPTLKWWKQQGFSGGQLAELDARELGLGGWSIDIHHAYDARTGSVLMGDGRVLGGVKTRILERVAGNYSHTGDQGDNLPALDDEVWISFYVRGLAVGPDGTIYIAQGGAQDDAGSRVRAIDRSGIIHTIAGSNAPLQVTDGGAILNPEGDGGSAASAHFDTIYDVAVGPDGSLYLADNGHNRVRRIDKAGIVSTIAGTGEAAAGANGISATRSAIGDVRSVAVGPDGSVFIAETGNNRVRRVGPDGIITTYAGGGTADVDEIRATDAFVAPFKVAVSSDGTLYIADWGEHSRVRKVTPDGTIHQVPGLGPGGIQKEDSVRINLLDVAVGPDGTVFALTGQSIYALSNGVATAVAGMGTGTSETVPYRDGADEGWPAVGTRMRGPKTFACAPNGAIYFWDEGNRIMRVTSPVPGSSAAQYVLPDPSRDLAYEFDAQGRHLRTRHSTTGAELYSFTYDAAGRLVTITQDGNADLVTAIERNTSGTATAIVGPYGQRTAFSTYDANGYVTSIDDPVGHSVAITYDDSGRVTDFFDKRQHHSHVDYDALGLGLVTKDEQVETGFAKSLSVVREGKTKTIDVTTSLGVKTRHVVDVLPDGSATQTTTYPDGTIATTTRGLDEVTRSTQADGTAVETKREPDPVWGMSVPMVTTTTKVPDVPAQEETTTRTVTTGSSYAVLTNEAVTHTVNKLATTVVYTFDSVTGTRKYVTTLPQADYSTPARSYTRFVDALGQTTSLVAPSPVSDVTLVSDFEYDAGRLKSTSFYWKQGTLVGTKRVSTLSYHAASDSWRGYLESILNPKNELTSFVRDALGRPLTTTAAAGTPVEASTATTWDGNGNLTDVTPPGKTVHNMTYTPVDLLDSYNPPLAGLTNATTEYQHDTDKLPTREDRPDGSSVVREYENTSSYSPKTDRIHKLTMSKPSQSDRVLDYAYYGSGDCPAAPCPAGVVPGKLKSITGPDGTTLTYTYSGSLPKGVSWTPSAGTVSWTYDAFFRPITEAVSATSGGGTTYFGYDNTGLLTCAAQSSFTACPTGALSVKRNARAGVVDSTTLGGVTDSYTYTNYGELARYEAKYTPSGSTTPVTLYTVIYDEAAAPRDTLGRVSRKTETLQTDATQTSAYEYDALGRLVRVRDQAGTLVEDYGYDLNGNRTSATTPAGAVTTTDTEYDAQDRMLRYGSYTYTYTANGELATKTGPEGTTTYTYDQLGSLISVQRPAPQPAIQYLVDGEGRRVAKKVGTTVTKRWLYRDRLKPVAELDGAGNVVARFVYGTKQNVPDYVIRADGTYRVVSDQLGSPVLAVNVSTGAVAYKARYDSFGVVTALPTSSGATTDLGWMPFGFAGGMYDGDTGLVRFGARDYEPGTGRWTGKDPIRWKGGQANLYGYVLLDPVNLVDPKGTDGTACAICNLGRYAAIAACTLSTEGVGFWGCSMAFGGSVGIACAALCNPNPCSPSDVYNCRPPPPPPDPCAPPRNEPECDNPGLICD